MVTPQVSHQLLCLEDMTDSGLKRFWDWDSTGICVQETVRTEGPVLKSFEVVSAFMGHWDTCGIKANTVAWVFT